MYRSPEINMVGNTFFPSSEGEGIYSSPNGQKPFSGVREAPTPDFCRGEVYICIALSIQKSISS